MTRKGGSAGPPFFVGAIVLGSRRCACSRPIAGLLLGPSALAAGGAEASRRPIPASTSTAARSSTDGETPAFAEWRCRGYGGIPLFVQSGDERYDVDAGVQDEDALWAATFDYPGKTVEWRLSAGKPFAIIYRLELANPERPRIDDAGGRDHREPRPAGLPGGDDPGLGQERESASAIGRRSACFRPGRRASSQNDQFPPFQARLNPYIGPIQQIGAPPHGDVRPGLFPSSPGQGPNGARAKRIGEG